MALAEHRSDLWSSALRVFILYANPLASSFGAALHNQCVEILRSRGHEVDDCDLYVERFDPVLSEQERMQYHDTRLNRQAISAYADRLLAAEALILVYPSGMRGFLQCSRGSSRLYPRGKLHNRSRWRANSKPAEPPKSGRGLHLRRQSHDEFLLGDPPKRVVKRLVRSMPGHAVRCDYLAHYDLDRSTPSQRAAFLKKVKRTFETW